MAQWFERW
ncbi:unnamed protein product, partial [Rotaria socialis]